MKKLSEADIIRIMKEEWEAKVKALAENVDLTFTAKVDGDKKEVISDELKIRHIKSKFLYTVLSVGPRDVTLMTPEGEEILVSKDKLEKEYELD